MLKIVLFIVLAFLPYNSCICSYNRISDKKTSFLTGNCEKVEIDYRALGKIDGNKLVINADVDLEGKICHLPEGIKLCPQGGLLKNGELVGENSIIENDRPVFNNIRISGSWIVSTIRTSMFVNIEGNNELKNVFALTNPKINNKVIIENGNYSVSANYPGDACLAINSNTEVVLNGTIYLKPNAFVSYDILRIEGENVSLKGNGCLYGDKSKHGGTAGEWGMGLHIHNSRNVLVTGIKISECWGDCIYVGGESEKIRIEKCVLSDGRRQGISITSARGVYVKNCFISNISGTAPEYAIDIEPNKGEICDNILVEKVSMINCKGGFSVYGKAKDAYVGNVTIRNSEICGDGKSAVCIIECDQAIVERCELMQKDFWKVLDCRDIKELKMNNNSFQLQESTGYKMKSILRKTRVRSSNSGPIHVANCDKVFEKNNFEFKVER